MDPDIEGRAQKRIAREYRLLGYDVVEHPTSDGLPEFMVGAISDIVARSASDNVVIEVKRHGSLKGSNDLVNIAERVSKHLSWLSSTTARPNVQGSLT